MFKLKPASLVAIAIFGFSQLAFVPTVLAKENPSQQTSSIQASRYQQDAELIKHTFESQLYTLNASTAGHYGLRMFRQTLDLKYSAAVWSDMARVTSTLNEIATEIHTRKQAKTYGQKKLQYYKTKGTVRTQMRYEATKDKPEYLFLGIDFLALWLAQMNMV